MSISSKNRRRIGAAVITMLLGVGGGLLDYFGVLSLSQLVVPLFGSAAANWLIGLATWQAALLTFGMVFVAVGLVGLIFYGAYLWSKQDTIASRSRPVVLKQSVNKTRLEQIIKDGNKLGKIKSIGIQNTLKEKFEKEDFFESLVKLDGKQGKVGRITVPSVKSKNTNIHEEDKESVLSYSREKLCDENGFIDKDILEALSGFKEAENIYVEWTPRVEADFSKSDFEKIAQNEASLGRIVDIEINGTQHERDEFTKPETGAIDPDKLNDGYIEDFEAAETIKVGFIPNEYSTSTYERSAFCDENDVINQDKLKALPGFTEADAVELEIQTKYQEASVSKKELERIFKNELSFLHGKIDRIKLYDNENEIEVYRREQLCDNEEDVLDLDKLKAMDSFGKAKHIHIHYFVPSIQVKDLDGANVILEMQCGNDYKKVAKNILEKSPGSSEKLLYDANGKLIDTLSDLADGSSKKSNQVPNGNLQVLSTTYSV